MARRGPTGWPRDLPPAGTAEFDEKVVALAARPRAGRPAGVPDPALPGGAGAVRLPARGCQLDGTRGAYASARVELGEHLSPDGLATVQAALESEGARLLQIQREVALVEDVLRRQ